MAKAILCGQSTSNKAVFVVVAVYADGTDITKVASPATGQLLIPVQGNFWSVGDTVPAETICNGLAIIVGSSSTTNWTPVKAAIN